MSYDRHGYVKIAVVLPLVFTWFSVVLGRTFYPGKHGNLDLEKDQSCVTTVLPWTKC